jgi:hypothetical protein
MTIRTAFVACALALAILAAGTAAYAADPYGGFGPSPSESAPPETNADPANAGPPPGAYRALPWLQQQSQNQPEGSGSGAWDQPGPVSGDYDMDDEGGH